MRTRALRNHALATPRSKLEFFARLRNVELTKIGYSSKLRLGSLSTHWVSHRRAFVHYQVSAFRTMLSSTSLTVNAQNGTNR